MRFTAAQTVSVAAAVLVAGVASFQVALALGAPLGGAVLGGRASTQDGVLSGGFRVLAIAQAVILLLIAWVVLARTGVAAIPIGSRTVAGATWLIAAFLALNTLANFSAPHPVERWVMGSITLVLSVFCLFIALRGPDAT